MPQLRSATLSDLERIQTLYQETARLPGGIARSEEEITSDYIGHNLRQALARGISLVIEHPDDPNVLIAEIHTYPLVPKAFKHVLGELTIVVHPSFHGQGYGRRLFSALLSEIESKRPDILRVELICRESNQRAIGLYQSLGFRIEGRLERRITNSHGDLESDIPMAWFNKNYGL